MREVRGSRGSEAYGGWRLGSLVEEAGGSKEKEGGTEKSITFTNG